MTVDQKDGTKRHLFQISYIDELKRRKWDNVSYELIYLKNGAIKLEFHGPWLSAMFSETPVMAIISEVYYFHLWQQRGFKSAEFSSFYAEMYQRIIRDCAALKEYPGLTFSQFGHRRRHSRMWEVLVQETFMELLPTQCVAPSNVWLAFKMGQNNPKGTNAHELPMVWATLNGNTDAWIQESPYDMVNRWNAFYPELAILLPDTFRTTAFLAGASAELAHEITGVRIDSKIEEESIPELLDWFRRSGADPMSKVFVPSDGLTASRMIKLYELFAHQVGMLTFGYGTQGTNQVNGILPYETGFHTISMVIKVIEANGFPTVKLSDNPNKHTGSSQKEIERYDHLFSKAGEHKQAVVV
jgi:nicotinate phosphoribosyltransferase